MEHTKTTNENTNLEYRKKGFYFCVLKYCIVILFLAFINYQFGGWQHHKWFLYPLVFWGLGLMIKG